MCPHFVCDRLFSSMWVSKYNFYFPQQQVGTLAIRIPDVHIQHYVWLQALISMDMLFIKMLLSGGKSYYSDSLSPPTPIIIHYL